ncbi:hypothetical protein C5C31_12555 [Rathayibacter rathayi]|uniref:Type II toxin-antitoxin system MqsR family toxin n=1 Tax=Rathayibacter rathayi TaxID=33887 RepID=A0ABD6WBR9_RATRA|nr:hypothetical protein [Rathayibacter rathayi]AZZ48420.1 hypothetical protein C1O28_03735 [Rathayibacter rathayi]MWV74329.1 hypothetical protein [Rathayibacter rathayi NCPPB 2980 = VKM Ac-1601]PPF15932.1 hypothetical protein C5C04_01565 [Rathayibacter rathayi]PPF22747.1 hypothetical protein C5C34_11415 [Rathayibacter rathayi]PPF47616.1 hypothetical protein C5C08_10960 [Rathayibacter rathayi]
MSAFALRFTQEAARTISTLEGDKHLEKKLRKVRRALGLLQTDPRYPSLNSHKYYSMSGTNGEDIWDSYIENNTASAWRIFWHYGPGGNMITVVAITPHP